MREESSDALQGGLDRNIKWSTLVRGLRWFI